MVNGKLRIGVRGQTAKYLGWSVVISLTVCFVAAAGGGEQPPLPKPGIGLFFKAGEVPRLREKIQQPPCQAVYQQLLKMADEGLVKWQQARASIIPLVSKLPDLTMEFVPDRFTPPRGKEAGRILEQFATYAAPAAAFVYLMTGERKYAEFAWDVFEQCAKVNR